MASACPNWISTGGAHRSMIGDSMVKIFANILSTFAEFADLPVIRCLRAEVFRSCGITNARGRKADRCMCGRANAAAVYPEAEQATVIRLNADGPAENDGFAFHAITH